MKRFSTCRMMVMLFMCLAACVGFAQAQEKGEEVNTGQDFTKPLTRLDIRQKYQLLAQDKFASVTTFRVDKPFVLGNKWVLSTRFDFPFMTTDAASRDNPNADREFGSSDFLAQFMMIAPQAGKTWTWAYGVQTLWPAASQDEMGTGRYQIAPLLGGKMDLGFLKKGSFAGMLLCEHIDAGGSDSRVKQNYLVVQPLLNINLPKAFFLNMSPEMRVNWENDNRWFVPFDIMLGKMLNKSTAVSLEYKTPLCDRNYPMYDHEVEARVGFFF